MARLTLAMLAALAAAPAWAQEQAPAPTGDQPVPVVAAPAEEKVPAPPPPPSPTRVTLTVEIANFRNDTGRAMVAIYRTKDDYLKQAETGAHGKIAGGKATVVLENLNPGTLVVSAFHDENENGKLDSNWIGMPKEGTGVSRDAKGRMGPPKFNDAKLDLAPGATTIVIHLVYL